MYFIIIDQNITTSARGKVKQHGSQDEIKGFNYIDKIQLGPRLDDANEFGLILTPPWCTLKNRCVAGKYFLDKNCSVN